MTAPKVDLEKFNGKNDFNMWKVKMEALLITQGLGEALEPTTKKEGYEGSSSKSPEIAAEIDKKARSTIILSLSDSVIREVAKERTVAELWTKLENLYMTKSLANRLYIKKRMFSLKMAEGSSLEEHIDEFNRVCDTLETIDEGLNDEGHFKKDCPEKKQKRKDQNGDAAIVADEGYESARVCVATNEVQKGKWILDSGCTFHMSPEKSYFSDYHEYDGGRVMMRNNAVCKVTGMGNIHLKLHDGTVKVLKQILNGSTLIMKGKRKNEVYVLDGEVVTGESSVSVKANTDITRLWHLRLGHISLKGLKELEKQGVLGADKIEELDFCEGCVLGKSTRASFKKSVHKTKSILDYVHSDLWGPSQVPSLGGNRFFMSIIDDYSRKVWVYVLMTKDQVFGKFKEWKALVENQTGKKLKVLKTDNGLEYCNKMFDEFCSREGIARHITVRLTPQHNGLAERMNRTLMEKVRCMMIQSKLPKGLWAETLLTACVLVNLNTSSTLDFKTPYEKWCGKPANYSKLKVFGCTAYAHANQGKLAPRALKGMFIGYPEGVKGYKIWYTDLSPPKCIVSRDVVFNEQMGHSEEKPIENAGPQNITNGVIQFEVEHPVMKMSGEPSNSDEEVAGNRDTRSEHQRTHTEDYHLAKDRERRIIRPPKRFGYADLSAYALATSRETDEEEPRSYKEAMQSSYKTEWQQAMNEEMSSFYKNNTWELVMKPEKRKLIGCKWIYKIKDGLTASEPRRFKARLVAKGYTQKEGVDFKEVFSPIVRHTSIRVLLAMTAVYDMELDQLDVKTAFVHGILQEEILMVQPEGYVDPEKPAHVCLLKKSLYGLKQSPRQWYLRFDEFITSNGFKRCSFDCCVYYKLLETHYYIYLLLYVDDMLITCKIKDEIEALKELLSSEFDMKDLGHAKKILGMDIKRNRKEGTMFLSQGSYVKKIVKTFGMSACKSVITPLASHFKLSNLQCAKTDDERREMEKFPYANAVGCMMYAMVLTRPDISYALSIVSRYMATPGKEHWQAVKWILRYLSGTDRIGLLYGRSEGRCGGLWGYVDSDFTGDNDRGRSLTGYLFMLNGCIISWKASLQHVVALSTTEAEYTATTEAVKEALWLKGMIEELGVSQKTVEVHCDSSSAIYLSKNLAHHQRTKHIDVKLHFIRNEMSKGIIKMVKVHTDDNPADILTKVVPSAKFKACLNMAGVESL
ncbi:Integrase catalytic domain-containing protein [Citrus sinensis]|uniref:Integrase catalytic domain-containing protein n=1 Tax=Citrus sinensis TaxID=2711 RepID=A0ACB8M9A1_CITSI|nr:Integrase catalytic domain-containing protein [Citrus sinensis]